MNEKYTEKQIDARRKARRKYCSNNIIYKSVALNKKTDEDILEYIKNIESFSGYVHNLIREDMNKEKAI